MSNATDHDMDKFELSFPAASAEAEPLHAALISTGQALSANEMPEFFFSKTDDSGELLAGCKGEIAFKSVHISEVWVSERLRGHGIGSSLLLAAEDFAKQQDCTRIHLETRNEPARKLYEKLGYRVFGTLENYQDDQAFYYLEKSLV